MTSNNNVCRVKVSITTLDGLDKRAVATYVENGLGSETVRVREKDLVCNGDEVVFELLPGKSLTIEGFPAQEVTYDRDQFVASQAQPVVETGKARPVAAIEPKPTFPTPSPMLQTGIEKQVTTPPAKDKDAK